MAGIVNNVRDWGYTLKKSKKVGQKCKWGLDFCSSIKCEGWIRPLEQWVSPELCNASAQGIATLCAYEGKSGYGERERACFAGTHLRMWEHDWHMFWGKCAWIEQLPSVWGRGP